jgi:hypothetical protein
MKLNMASAMALDTQAPPERKRQVLPGGIWLAVSTQDSPGAQLQAVLKQDLPPQTDSVCCVSRL